MNCYYPASNCAIAYEIRQIFPDAIVSPTHYYPFGNGNVFISPSHDGGHFINAFDRSTPEQRLELPETTVTLDINDAILDRINIEEVETLLKDSKNLQLV